MQSQGLPPHASPLFRPWNLVVGLDEEKFIAVFAQLSGGIASIRWVDLTGQLVPPLGLARDVAEQLGLQVNAVIALPRVGLGGRHTQESLEAAAHQHVMEVERANRLGRLGNLTGLTHLAPFLQTFLEDHPDPTKNVFIMMRFFDSPQMRSIHKAINKALLERGYHGVRADDRDYSGELWTNIEVCMVSCQLGLAVFEDIEERYFNPNVSLELGYMLARGRRCLILKERRLPNIPTDVIHRLYKPFDMFNIHESVQAQVLRWIDVDLGGIASG
jgi:hypothetical protein